MLAAARLLADAAVDVIAWNGTAGFWLGTDHDLELCAAIEKDTGSGDHPRWRCSMRSARSASPLGLAVPYTADVTDRIVARYREHGIECVSTAQLGLTATTSTSAGAAERVRQLIEQAADGDPHAVAVVCTNVAGLPTRPNWSRAGIPVMCSVSATLWRRSTRRWPAIVPEWGQLLASGALRARLPAAALEDCSRATEPTAPLEDGPAALGLRVRSHRRGTVAPGVRSIRRDGSLDQLR